MIPTDCLAAVLKQALPDAEHLVPAFDARTHVSPGTARTMVESFRHGRRGGPGANTIVHLASSPQLADVSGGYFYDSRRRRRCASSCARYASGAPSW